MKLAAVMFAAGVLVGNAWPYLRAECADADDEIVRLRDELRSRTWHA